MNTSYININSISSCAINGESSIQDYIKLTKPRIMFLVVFTAICGMLLAPSKIHLIIAFTSVICISFAAGSAAAINMWYDRDIDAIMQRTCKRPIVVAVIAPDDALAFGMMLGIISVIIMAVCVNLLSALLLLTTILYYVFVYTIWLKRTSIYNIVIGGVSGALPPMIGWASVENNISLESISLFMIIFLWTPPHSWALALFKNQDYVNSHIPMMPAIRGALYTKKQILIYSVLMVISTYIPFILNMCGIVYLFLSGAMNIIFMYYVMKLFSNDKSDIHAKKLFFFSILYLFTIFLLCIIDK